MALPNQDEHRSIEREEHSKFRDCGEGALDCFAFLGRSCVTTGKAVHRVTGEVAYPVKEGVVRVLDDSSNHFNPYQRRQQLTGAGVTTFTG